MACDEGMRFNVYVDGTWLWYQCGPGRILANRMEFPENPFRCLDFAKLIEFFRIELADRIEARGDGAAAPEVDRLHFYTALFESVRRTRSLGCMAPRCSGLAPARATSGRTCEA